MCRLLLFLLWWCLLPVLLSAQDALQEVPEPIEDIVAEEWLVAEEGASKSKDYLRRGYYNHIGKEQPFTGEFPQEFDQMMDKYQSEDFQYAKSIKDQLSFLDRMMNRFWRVVESLFPKQEVFKPEDFYNVMALLGAVLVIYLIYRFFMGNKVYTKINKEEEEEGSIAFVERNLMQVDVGKYIEDALRRGDYALAIRYQQLRNIQIMTRKGWVEYEHTKTNRELLDSVQNVDLQRDFRYCTDIFDRVWFGNFPIGKEEYLRFSAEFERFQKGWS